MYINNYVVISFLIITIMNVINFGTHDTDCIPALFPYDFDIIFCNLKINKGSLYCYNIHIHHWLIGLIGLIILSFVPNTWFKSILTGVFLAAFIDGLLFNDRFKI